MKKIIVFLVFAMVASSISANTEKDVKECPVMMERPPMMEQRTDIIARVKSVDLKDNRLTVTNSDGIDITLQVSPFTRIINEDSSMPKMRKNEHNMQGQNQNQKGQMQGQKVMQKDGQNQKGPMETPRDQNKGPRPSTVELKSLNSGDWVSICTFKTGTKILDASVIRLAK